MGSVFQKLPNRWKPHLPYQLCTIKLPDPSPESSFRTVEPLPHWSLCLSLSQMPVQSEKQRAGQPHGFVFPPGSLGHSPATCLEF